MPTRSASATWNGDLKTGNGNFKGSSGALQGTYSFGTRFESVPGTNPEELIGAAHASCYSMALAFSLSNAGMKPQSVSTTAAVTLDMVGEGPKITRIKLTCQASVPGADPAKFQEIATATKTGCPISAALSAVPIELEAKLV
jgi:osmotically inducible protein OsmC